MQQERVTLAAVRLLDGTILTGTSHWDIMADGADDWPEEVWFTATDGFVTSEGRFVDREEAGALVGCAEGEGFMAEGLFAEDEEYPDLVRRVGCACAEHIATPTLRLDRWVEGRLAGTI